MQRWFFVVLILSVLASPTRAENLPILVEGDFADWTPTSLAFTDVAGDDGSSGIDFQQIWCANDENYWYLRFETTAEVQGDEQQSMRLYLDSDFNSGTGTQYQGIGADLIWDFGSRDGDFLGTNLGHEDIGLLLGPTVSNTQFEIGIRRDVFPNGVDPLFPAATFRFILRDLAGSGDVAPNVGSVSYTFVAGSQPVPPLNFDKDSPTHLRVCAFNIQSDGLFDGGATENALNRIFDRIDADVFVLNEVWSFDANDVQSRMEFFLPSGAGETWHTVKLDSGNVIASRYPILSSWLVSPGDRITAARLDLSPDHDEDVLIVAAHFSCCSADGNRQDQADAMIEFLADARTPGGVISLPVDTPMVAAGDFNLVGLRRQLDTILTGDIEDNGTYGPDSAPDWDGSDFDLPPSRHTDDRVAYTWRNDNSSFYPGILDFIFYTGSVASLGNHFVLDTRTMSAASLAANGLVASDTEDASDHSPRVADLDLSDATSVPRVGGSSWLLPNVPNPFNPSTTLRFGLAAAGTAALDIFDARGRHVIQVASGRFPSGVSEVVWSGVDERGRPVGSGVYHVRLTSAGQVAERKITLVQ